MRKSYWFVLIVALLAVGAPTALRADDITYTVALTVGPGSATGTITTDGTIGTLATADILAWNLMLNDGTSTVTLTNGSDPHNAANVSGPELTATATDLFYNFSGSAADFFLIEDNSFSSTTGGMLFFTNPNPGDLTFPSSGIEIHDLLADNVLTTSVVSGNQVIGTVVAPEPGSFAFMLAGIGLLLLARKSLA